MSVEVKVPPVGESISSGVVSVWLKKNGDAVKEGDALFTLETDKVSTEIVAEKSGQLETLVPEGQEVKIGQTVARIDDSKPAGKSEGGDGAAASPQPSTAPAAAKAQGTRGLHRLRKQSSVLPGSDGCQLSQDAGRCSVPSRPARWVSPRR
jgi:2-oxoglutarate dehydrogenase E2 component (dihydrolipoamide succinyltransferase)